MVRASSFVAVASLVLPTVAFAIGPNDQVIPDAPNPLRLGATGIMTGAGTSSGTGTVIGAVTNNGSGYVTILTADHVGSTLQNLQLGSGLGTPQSYTLSFTGVTYKPYRVVDPANNPNNLPEDVGVVLGTINLNGNAQAQAAFNILANNLPTVTNPMNGNPLVMADSGAINVGFTQLGYGISGAYKTNIMDPNLQNRGNGYQDDGTFGKRGFQNNTALTYTAPSVQTYGKSMYYEPVDSDKALDQGNGGTGSGFPGDSGGPWYTGGAASQVAITRNNNPLVVPVNDTDNLSAVFVAGTPATFVNGGNDQIEPLDPTTILVNSTQLAVPIDQGLYNFLTPFIANPLAIPEPGSMLLILGGIPLLLGRNRAAKHSASTILQKSFAACE
jgi:hypothetical protein